MTEPFKTKSGLRTIDVFFYGLFMDENLLRQKGVSPLPLGIASVEGFCLVIGARATLAPCAKGTAHGVVFSLTHDDVDKLYSDASVNAYRPEAVLARLADGGVIPAICYNLPVAPSIKARSAEYAEQLRELACRIGLPRDYVASIN